MNCCLVRWSQNNCSSNVEFNNNFIQNQPNGPDAGPPTATQQINRGNVELRVFNTKRYRDSAETTSDESIDGEGETRSHADCKGD